MNKQLSPLEKGVRNTIIRDLYRFGLSVSSIAKIMNMTQSTVSRVTSKNVDEQHLMVMPSMWPVDND